MRKGLSIIVPCYNEKSRGIFNERINKLQSICSNLQIPYEIIYVDDGSSDGTDLVLRDSVCRVYYLPKNKGKYSAIQHGIKYSIYDTILMLDADLNINTQDIEYSYRNIEKYPVIIGVRYSRCKDKNKSLFRRILSFGSHFVSSKIFKLPQTDTQCGYKMFKKKLYESIDKPMICSRYLWDIEFLLGVKNFNVRVGEVPINYGGFKKSTFRCTPMLLGSLREFISLYRKYRRLYV